MILPFMFSCEMKKDLLDGIEKPTDPQLPKDAGILDLQLNPVKEVVIPNSKGDEIEGSDEILNAADFSVGIYDEEGVLVESYDSYSQLKETGGLLLSPGTYIIKAEKGNDLNAGFDKPYYKGVDTCIIQPQVVEKVITHCKLENKKVTFRYSEDFQKQFEEDYFVVVDNESGVLTLDKNETRSAFLKNTGTLRFTVYVTSKDGRQLIYNYDVSKNEQVNQHNNIVVDLGLINDNGNGGNDNSGDEGDDGDDDEPEDPGDTPPDIPTGKPIVSVDVSLVEKDFIIEIPSDILDGGGNEPDGDGDQPSGSAPSIVGSGFNIANAIEIPLSSPEKNIKVNISTPGKLASLQIDISESMWTALDMAEIDHSFDMCNLSAELETKLTGLGLAVPAKQAIKSEFNITEFVPLIALIGEGKYSFSIKVVDEAGKTASAKLTIVMTNN